MASRRSRHSSQDKDDDYLYESDNTSEYEEEEEEDEDDEFDISTVKVKKTNKRKHEGDDSDSSSESDHSSGCKNKKCKGSEAKKRRVRYGWACTMCKLKHRSCDGQRPCGRCKSEGFADTCSDGPCCGSGSASEVCRGKEPSFLGEAKIKKEENDQACFSTQQACAAGRHLIKQEPGSQQCSAGKPSSLSLLEHKIVAKVAEAVAIRVDALTGASANKQPFLFQFLEPPKRVIGSSIFPPTPQMVSRALNPYWPEKLFPQSFSCGGQYVAPSTPMPSPKFAMPFLPEESFAPLQPQQQQATGFATTFVERERAGQPCWNVTNNCQQGYELAYTPIESSACGEDNTFYSQNDLEAFLA